MDLQFLAFPPTRLLASIAAGLVVSLVLSEGLLALLPWLVHGFERPVPAAAMPEPAALAWQLLIWTLAAFVSATLAAAMAGPRSAGWVAGGLWLFPILLSWGLMGLDSRMLLAAALLVVTATLAGAGLARRVENSTQPG